MDKAERHTLRDAPQSLRDLLDVLAVNVPKGYSTKVLLRKVKMISAEEHDKLLDYLENKLWVL
jgi:predicted AAA+ superfamily ATPase